MPSPAKTLRALPSRYGLALVLLAALLWSPVVIAQQLPPPGPNETYKGVTLVGTAYEDRTNAAFFKNVRMAIDMVRGLPKQPWNRTGLIKEIVYDPPSKFRKRNDVSIDIVGVYTVTDPLKWPAPIVVYQNMAYSSPLNIALSIVGNAMLAGRHRQLLVNAKTLKDMREGSIPFDEKKQREAKRGAERIWKLMTKKASPDELYAADCEIKVAELNAHKHIHPDHRKISAMTRRLNEGGCL